VLIAPVPIGKNTLLNLGFPTVTPGSYLCIRAYLWLSVVAGVIPASLHVTLTTLTDTLGIRLVYDAVVSNNGATDVLIWGAQLEQGSTPTSYIPTSGSTVTRAKDSVTDLGDVTTFNSEEGVLFVEMAALSDDLILRYITLSDGTINNRLSFGYSSTTNEMFIVLKVNNINQVLATNIPIAQINFNKVALKYKENDFAIWINGIEVFTDNSGIVLPLNTFNTLNLAQYDGTFPLYAKIRQLKVFKTALTDEQLTILTS